MKNKIFLIIMISLAALSTAFAGGGGGMFWQQQVAQYPFAEDWEIAEAGMNLVMFGGFGYGIADDGRITGGYGYGIVSEEDEVTGEVPPGAVSGGFGGVINGYQVMDRPLHIAFISYAGIGGLYEAPTETHGERGHFAMSLEVDVEVGLPIFGWFMPVVYAGYQYVGSVFPDESDEIFQTYSPVLGCRMSFGDFRR